MAHWDLEILKDAKEMAEKVGLKRMNDYTYISVAKRRNIQLITMYEQLISNGKKFHSQIVHTADFKF